jgi:hypothetical protein
VATFGEALTAQREAKRDHRDVDVVLDGAVAEKVRAIDERIDALELEREELYLEVETERAAIEADKRLGDPRPAELDAREQAEMARIGEAIEKLEAEREAATEGTLWTFRFEKLPGPDWAGITVRNPARIDVGIDRRWGYNYHEVAKAAAAWRDAKGYAYGAVLHRAEPAEGDREAVPESREELTPEQWADLWDTLSGHEFERIASNIWELNEYGPQQRVEAAGKAFRVGTGSK